MSNYIIPENKKYHINFIIKQITIEAIISIICTTLFLIISSIFIYFLIFKPEYFTNNNLFFTIIFIIVCLLIFTYGFHYSFIRILKIKRMKNDLKFNSFNKINDKPIKITFHITSPGLRKYNRFFSISNIKIYFNKNDELITLWINDTYFFDKQLDKDKMIRTLKSYHYDLTYMSSSKYITTNQVNEYFSKYLKPYIKK